MFKNKFVLSIFFFLFIFVGYAYPQSNANKPAFNPYSANVVVFINGYEESENNLLKRKLTSVLKNANIEDWNINKSDYSSVRFINGTSVHLSNSITENNLFLYKKGKPYMVLNLSDSRVENIINKYFDNILYPDLIERNKRVVEDSSEGIIYIKYSQQEIFEESLLYDAEEKIHIQKFRNTKLKTLKNYARQLSVPYKEAGENISEIVFNDSISISLSSHSGAVILFKQGKTPQIHFVTDISLPMLKQYFNK